MFPLVVASCSENKLAGPGGDCFQATDCEDGLVCVPSGNRKVCSNDITGLQTPPAKDASLNDAARADAPVPNDAYRPPDTSVPDTRPPVDTGVVDTGTD
ncbi:hypothetical protein [Pendulispora albinea]|uniref:Dickkopf N-terminal cysteine-rich domain-containing protein n=1 Tax=Pendulispora albinea TaxID=2741071 RepID=A0ABZ2M9U2_9BACT